MEKKITYAQALEVAINEVTDEEVKERLVALKATLAKKYGNKKPTKTQVANEGLKDKIVEVLVTADKGLTVTEILSKGAFGADVTNQKVTALLRQLIADGKVVKEADKKKSYFKAVAEA